MNLSPTILKFISKILKKTKKAQRLLLKKILADIFLEKLIENPFLTAGSRGNVIFKKMGERDLGVRIEATDIDDTVGPPNVSYCTVAFRTFLTDFRDFF